MRARVDGNVVVVVVVIVNNALVVGDGRDDGNDGGSSGFRFTIIPINNCGYPLEQSTCVMYVVYNV